MDGPLDFSSSFSRGSLGISLAWKLNEGSCMGWSRVPIVSRPAIFCTLPSKGEKLLFFTSGVSSAS